MAAAVAGMGEVEVSRVAEEKSQDQEVQQYARKMIEDHTKANQELMELARSKNVQLPQQPEIKDIATVAALAGCDSSKFDQAYIDQQEAAHVIAVGLFKAETEQGRDAEIREWAETTLPKLEQHLQMARQMKQGRLGRPGRRSFGLADLRLG